MESNDKYIGKQISNYHITKAIDSGTFGRVYQGVHLYLSNRIVAIKVMHRTYLGSPQQRENFLQEARFLEQLKHPHILPIYDVGVDEGFPYIVAEFAARGSLCNRLERYEPNLMPLDEALEILSQVGQALQYVHEQNIVHRDLKPENILFNIKEEALLADFGIAVFLETRRTEFVDVIGSPLYMAPEQFEGIASRRSDQYALACIAYELFTGRPPFEGRHALAIGRKHQQEPPLPPRQINPSLPAHIDKAVLKALAKKRADRYPDVASFIAALLALPADVSAAETFTASGSLLYPAFHQTASAMGRTKEEWMDEGNRLYNLGRFLEALTAFDRSIQQDPNYCDPYEGRASALCSLGRYEEALVSVERAIHLDPNYAPAHNNKGNILYEQRNYEEALPCYERAIQLDPNYADAYFGKANALYWLKRYEEALAVYAHVILLDPTSSPAYDGKAWTLRQLQRFDEALAASEQAIRLDPENASAHNGKARALFRLGRLEESLPAFDEAIRLDPLLAQAYDFKADSLYHLRRYEDAYATYDRATQLNPRLASSYEGKGNVLSNWQRYQEALVAYDQAVNADPESGAFMYKRGDALQHLGRIEEAQQAYEKALQLGYQG